LLRALGIVGLHPETEIRHMPTITVARQTPWSSQTSKDLAALIKKRTA
jgi:hypothetical protein